MIRLHHHDDDVTELHCATRRSRFLRFSVRAFLVRGTLVDCGFPRVGRELGAWLDHARPAGVMLTHGHEDHAGNIPEIAAREIPVQMAPGTADLVREPGRIGWYRRMCWGDQQPFTGTITPYLHPTLALRPTPGHSPDHHVVWDAERGTVFGGDLFIGVKVRIAHVDEDLRGQIASLREVASWHPERFFDAHRGRLTDPVNDLRAKADWIEETIAAVEDRIRRGWDDAAIRTDVLGREDSTGIVSFGDYSRLNFVRSVRSSMN